MRLRRRQPWPGQIRPWPWDDNTTLTRSPSPTGLVQLVVMASQPYMMMAILVMVRCKEAWKAEAGRRRTLAGESAPAGSGAPGSAKESSARCRILVNGSWKPWHKPRQTWRQSCPPELCCDVFRRRFLQVSGPGMTKLTTS